MLMDEWMMLIRQYSLGETKYKEEEGDNIQQYES